MSFLKSLRIAGTIFLAIVASFAQAQDKPFIKIATKDNLLVMSVDNGNKLKQYYYGKNIDITDSSPKGNPPDAYPTFGVNVVSSALRVTHADGNTTTELVYKSSNEKKLDANSNLTTIVLQDSFYPLTVSICYKTYIKENIIEQWVEVKNGEKGTVTLNDYASASLSFQSGSYFLTSYNGNWANEFNLVEDELKPGTKIIDTKLGVRSTQNSSPAFLLSLNEKLNEDKGEVIGGTLAWPGNWQLAFDVDDTRKLKVSAGMNPYAAQYQLDAGASFKTAPFLYTYTTNGAGDVSRRFQRWARSYGIADGYGKRDILLNNWEATYFDFDEAKLTNIIKEAGAMGFELFLLDDGWFGNKYPRNNDNAGLGDWEVNTKKLPHGIAYLAQQCKENNLKFGIWIEPEMVNPKSELYEKHPDWILTAKNRALDPQRNQFILDLTNPAVQEYVSRSLEKLVSGNPGISYLKWDCNRYLTNPGSSYLGKDRQSHLYTEYPKALVSIMQKFRAKFPKVTMMLCAGGGGRIDYGSMPYFQEYWPSDNTDAVDRVKIQWGLSYFFPAVGLASHVSVTPNHNTGRVTPLKFRFDVAMAGKLGMDLQPMQMSAEEKAFSKLAIETYKGVRDITLHGDQYRLLSPYESERTAQMFVSEDQKQALVFSYLLKKAIYGNDPVLYLKGLNPTAKYKVTEINKVNFSRVGDYEGKVFTGEYLVARGLKFTMYNEYESNALLLTAQE